MSNHILTVFAATIEAHPGLKLLQHDEVVVAERITKYSITKMIVCPSHHNDAHMFVTTSCTATEPIQFNRFRIDDGDKMLMLYSVLSQYTFLPEYDAIERAAKSIIENHLSDIRQQRLRKLAEVLGKHIANDILKRDKEAFE